MPSSWIWRKLSPTVCLGAITGHGQPRTGFRWPGSGAEDPGHLAVAGLGHPHCEGVLAITDNDEANLAVTQTAALLRPDLPVITRTVSPAMAARMQVFGSPTVVNPFDRFGDHLRIALRAPASYQLLTWLESGPGAPCRSAASRRRAATGSCAATAGSAGR